MPMPEIIDMQRKREKVEEFYQWKEWADRIPFLDFDSNWEVKIIPPLKCTVIKFHLKHKEKAESWVSVLLEADNYFGGPAENPYWEVYPIDNCDSFLRIPLNETDKLLKTIRLAFDEQ